MSPRPSGHVERLDRRTTNLLAAGHAAAALVAAVLVHHGLAAPWRVLAVAPVLLGAATFPLFVRLAPPEPSALKLFAFSALTSWPLFTLIEGLARRSIGDGDASAAALLAVALLQLLAARRVSEEVRSLRRRPGAATALAVAAAAAFAVWVAWFVFGGERAPMLLRGEVLWHLGVVDRVVQHGPFGSLEHPWLAGAPLPSSPLVAALAAAFVRATGVAPVDALAGLAVVAAGLAPLLLYLLAASLWREARRDLAAVALGLFGWNALGGLLLAPPSSGGPSADPAMFDGTSWWARLSEAAPYGEGAVHFGTSAWLVAPALPLALIAALGALVAGVHAVRHGRAPWPLLAAGCAAYATLLHPPIGASVALPLAVTALVRGGAPRARLVLPSLVAIGLLPALASVARFGLAAAPVDSVGAGSTSELGLVGAAAALGGGAALLYLAAAAGGVAAWRARGSVAAGGGPIGAASTGVAPSGAASTGVHPTEGDPALVLLVATAVAPPLLALLLAPAGSRALVAELGAWAALPAGVLAAGGFGALLRGPRRFTFSRTVGAGLAVVLVAGSVRATAHTFRVHLGFVSAPSPLVAQGERIVPRDVGLPASREVARCYAYIAGRSDLRELDAIVVRFGAADASRVGGPDAPHIAALATGRPMWWDAPPGLFTRTGRTVAGDDWALRSQMIVPLFRALNRWDIQIAQLFQRAGRPLYFVVDEGDRQATTDRGAGPRGIDPRLLQLGAREVFRAGDASVLALDPRIVR
jgi:hypothetical protein